MKATKRQKLDMRRWRKTHRLENRRNSYKSSATVFIRHYASYNELERLKKLIDFYEPKRKKKATVN